MPSERIIRIMFGILYISSFFSPLAVYHSLSEPYIKGVLWAFMTPLGYTALIQGAILILYPKFKHIKYLSFPDLLLINGLLLIGVYLVQPVNFFLILWHGATGEYDIDQYSPLISLPFYIGILSIFYKILTFIKKYK